MRFWLALVACLPAGAAVCNPAAVQGVYGFQLSGATTISSSPQPVAAVGRLVLDGAGNVSGVSSTNFAGYFLGNPVTGAYQVHADCSIDWSLQDDSGGHQHFRGTLTPDGQRARFRQTDPGGARHGILVRTETSCGASNVTRRYAFTISGTTTPMLDGQTPGAVSLQGHAEVDPNGSVRLSGAAGAPATGALHVDGDCFAELDLSLPNPSGSPASMKFRAILVDGGRQILGIESDPGATVILTMTS